MSSDLNLGLESFVKRFFISQGADVDQRGGRLDVLAPGELAGRIGIPAFCSLTIGDADPSGFGIHYGSPLLEKIAEAAGDAMPLTVIRLVFHYLKSQGFDRLVDDLFAFHGAVVKVTGCAAVNTEYLLLNCRFLAQSDEQKEGLFPLTFNLDTGAPIIDITADLEATEKAFLTGAEAGDLSPEASCRVALWVQQQAPHALHDQLAPFQESMNRRFRRDVANLEAYYADLEQEMRAKLKRPGQSDQLVRDRTEKIDLIPSELAKKKDDLYKKYSIKVDLGLVGALLVRTPAVKLFGEATVGRRKKPLSLLYNPINKSIDPLVCAGCGGGMRHIHFCDHLHPLCSGCARRCPVCA
jgi:hypothetical protein